MPKERFLAEKMPGLAALTGAALEATFFFPLGGMMC